MDTSQQKIHRKCVLCMFSTVMAESISTEILQMKSFGGPSDTLETISNLAKGLEWIWVQNLCSLVITGF